MTNYPEYVPDYLQNLINFLVHTLLVPKYHYVHW